MTWEEVQQGFAEERKRNPPPDERFKMFAAYIDYLRNHPDEETAFFIRAGILEKDGKSFAAPYNGKTVDDE